MKTELGDRIGAILSQHIGREAAITAPDICAALSLPAARERLVRNVIASESPLWPVLVCGVPGAGYFIAADVEEADAYDTWLSELAKVADAKVTSFRESARRIGFAFPLPAAEPPMAAAA